MAFATSAAATAVIISLCGFNRNRVQTIEYDGIYRKDGSFNLVTVGLTVFFRSVHTNEHGLLSPEYFDQQEAAPSTTHRTTQGAGDTRQKTRKIDHSLQIGRLYIQVRVPSRFGSPAVRKRIEPRALRAVVVCLTSELTVLTEKTLGHSSPTTSLRIAYLFEGFLMKNSFKKVQQYVCRMG